MSDTLSLGKVFMRDTVPLSLRENLSSFPEQTVSSTPPLPSERGLGGEASLDGEAFCFFGVSFLPPLPSHLPKHLAVEAAFSL